MGQNEPTIRISGYLEKREKLHKIVYSWKKYWFHFEGHLLLYYRSKDEYDSLSPCKGSITLGPTCAMKSFPAIALGFQIQTRTSVITLRAENVREQKKWMQAILSTLNQNGLGLSEKLKHFRYSAENILQKVESENELANKRHSEQPSKDKISTAKKLFRQHSSFFQRIGKSKKNNSSLDLSAAASKVSSKDSNSQQKHNLKERGSEHHLAQKTFDNDENDSIKATTLSVPHNIYERVSGDSVIYEEIKNTVGISQSIQKSHVEEVLDKQEKDLTSLNKNVEYSSTDILHKDIFENIKRNRTLDKKESYHVVEVFDNNQNNVVINDENNSACTSPLFNNNNLIVENDEYDTIIVKPNKQPEDSTSPSLCDEYILPLASPWGQQQEEVYSEPHHSVNKSFKSEDEVLVDNFLYSLSAKALSSSNDLSSSRIVEIGDEEMIENCLYLSPSNISSSTSTNDLSSPTFSQNLYEDPELLKFCFDDECKLSSNPVEISKPTSNLKASLNFLTSWKDKSKEKEKLVEECGDVDKTVAVITELRNILEQLERKKCLLRNGISSQRPPLPSNSQNSQSALCKDTTDLKYAQTSSDLLSKKECEENYLFKLASIIPGSLEPKENVSSSYTSHDYSQETENLKQFPHPSDYLSHNYNSERQEKKNFVKCDHSHRSSDEYFVDSLDPIT